MNRRWFLAGALSVLVLTLGCRTPNRGPTVVHKVSNRTQSTTILIPGLESRLKLMQITDAHISLSVDRETNMIKYAERMHKAYTAPRRHFSQDTSKTTFEYLDDALQKAKKEQVELLLLTGDIVNFPSAASVEYVLKRLKQTGIPWLYIAGNHDWHYEGLEGSPDLLRQIWTEQSLLPLYQGRNPLCYSAVIKGINFVGIDNSTREVTQEQIDFLKAQLRRKEPITVLSHIPYNLSDAAGPRDMAAFAHTVLANRSKIIAIFAGHTHQSSFTFTGNLCQYISLPCFQGATLMVEIKGDAVAQALARPPTKLAVRACTQACPPALRQW